jgi:hypothetical protein
LLGQSVGHGLGVGSFGSQGQAAKQVAIDAVVVPYPPSTSCLPNVIAVQGRIGKAVDSDFSEILNGFDGLNRGMTQNPCHDLRRGRRSV